MDLGLEGKAAVVAGASRGMGRAIARGLAAEGARVALLARDAAMLGQAAAEIMRETGTETLAVPADVTRPDQVERAVTAAVTRFGRLDVVVPNAGGPPPGRFDAMTDAHWQQAFELSLLSTVRLVRAALPHLRRSGAGRIVTLQSTSIKQPIEGLLLSNGIRPGVQGLVKTLADEVAKDGITVNAVLPGRVLTDRARSFLESRSKATGQPVDEVRRATEAAIPVGYMGQPEDVAAVVVFLCSRQARYVTGQAIAVDGGLTRNLF